MHWVRVTIVCRDSNLFLLTVKTALLNTVCKSTKILFWSLEALRQSLFILDSLALHGEGQKRVGVLIAPAVACCARVGGQGGRG